MQTLPGAFRCWDVPHYWSITYVTWSLTYPAARIYRHTVS